MFQLYKGYVGGSIATGRDSHATQALLLFLCLGKYYIQPMFPHLCESAKLIFIFLAFKKYLFLALFIFAKLYQLLGKEEMKVQNLDADRL